VLHSEQSLFSAQDDVLLFTVETCLQCPAGVLASVLVTLDPAVLPHLHPNYFSCLVLHLISWNFFSFCQCSLFLTLINFCPPKYLSPSLPCMLSCFIFYVYVDVASRIPPPFTFSVLQTIIHLFFPQLPFVHCLMKQ
jgi:hypothetical protein